MPSFFFVLNTSAVVITACLFCARKPEVIKIVPLSCLFLRIKYIGGHFFEYLSIKHDRMRLCFQGLYVESSSNCIRVVFVCLTCCERSKDIGSCSVQWLGNPVAFTSKENAMWKSFGCFSAVLSSREMIPLREFYNEGDSLNR